ncbi:unnamed protein product, partial [Vitis vinifera]
MLKIQNFQNKWSLGWNILARMCSSGEIIKETADPTKRICKIMISCPKLELDTSLSESGIRVSPIVVENVLKRFENAGRVDEAVGIVKEMDSSVCKPTSFIYSVLVHTYGIENRIEDAVYTFLDMERNEIEADVAVYNALIGAFCKVNKLKNAYRVLNEMDCKGIRPNSRTCNIILNSLISCGDTDEAFRVFRRMIKVCDPDADTYTMMIKMFCENDKLEMALKVWKYMRLKQFVPSMHTFSVLINGLCKKGNASKACILLEEMIEKGIRPSSVTFGKLKQLLIKEGREDVLEFLQEKMNLLVKEPLCDQEIIANELNILINVAE